MDKDRLAELVRGFKDRNISDADLKEVHHRGAIRASTHRNASFDWEGRALFRGRSSFGGGSSLGRYFDAGPIRRFRRWRLSLYHRVFS